MAESESGIYDVCQRHMIFLGDDFKVCRDNLVALPGTNFKFLMNLRIVSVVVGDCGVNPVSKAEVNVLTRWHEEVFQVDGCLVLMRKYHTIFSGDGGHWRALAEFEIIFDSPDSRR